MKKFLKRVFRFFLFPLLVLGLIYGGYFYVYGNFHKIDDNAYRSAQLFSYNLPYYLKKYKIKSILNLRGKNPDKKWYQEEERIAKELNVTIINYPISAQKYVDFKKALEIVELLKNAQKPILIHCQAGADRTSFASALYQYALKDKDPIIAKEQLSVIYGHVPFLGNPTIWMDKSFDDFVDASPHLKRGSL